MDWRLTPAIQRGSDKFDLCAPPGYLSGMRTTLVLSIAAVVSGIVVTARADWPDFRGPTADGHVSAAGDSKPIGLPIEWSESKNVKWKTEIPYRGWSTPAIMGGQIWLTTATEDGHDFFAICVDEATGKIEIQRAAVSFRLARAARQRGQLLRRLLAGDRAGPRLRSLRQLRHGLPRHGDRQSPLEARRFALPPLSRAVVVAGDLREPFDPHVRRSRSAVSWPPSTRRPARRFGRPIATSRGTMKTRPASSPKMATCGRRIARRSW